ncbi:MAG TPA: protein kinase, partial [Labilithrix sp.]
MTAFTPAIREFLALSDETRRLGPYRCKGLLDKAGTAPVFRAVEEHAGLNLREVAVKVFDVGRGDGFQQRVVDEARSLCRVQHPNVIRFHTLSTDAKRGLMGIVMEFAEGVSVDKQLEEIPKGDPRRLALAVDIGIAISAALAAAHAAGVVHCNVKPSNIIFTGGTYKLLNFSVAASLRDSKPEKPGAESRRKVMLDDIAPDSIGRKAATLEKAPDSGAPITGTIGYVDPVCLRTIAPPTASSDLYSLGATLYEVLSGEVPAKNAGGVDSKILLGDAPPKPLAEVAPSVPAELAKLVDSLVAPTREARPRAADAVLRSFERVRSKLAGHDRALPSEERGPFPGLARYEASDRDVFFGRSAEIAGLLELARTRGLVGVVGASSSGKSSLLRAGVVPAIEDGALGGWPKKWRSVVVTPGADLMAALRQALEKVLVLKPSNHPAEIAQELAADVDATGEGLVIVIDALDEVVTQKDAARRDALDLLSRLADAPVGLRVVFTVRRDLLDGVLAIDPHFSRALSRGIQPFGPLTMAGWEEVLDQSLEAYGYTWSEGARKEALADIKGRESAMALVQFGLARLWGDRDAKKKTVGKLEGGMKGALEAHADATVAALDLPKEKLRDVLLAMTTPEGTRAHVTEDAIASRFGSDARKAVRALVKARLLLEDSDGVTFAHDSLLREWRLVRGWLEAARDDRLLSAHVERDATRWAESKDATMLWRKARLAAAVELESHGVVPLSESARTFLAYAAAEERKSKIMFWSAVVVVVAIISGGSLVYAKDSHDRAVQARKDADALASALAQVKALELKTQEEALENAATAQLLHDLQTQMADERTKYRSKVDDTLKRVASATSLDGAQKATADLSALKPSG